MGGAIKGGPGSMVSRGSGPILRRPPKEFLEGRMPFVPLPPIIDGPGKPLPPGVKSPPDDGRYYPNPGFRPPYSGPGAGVGFTGDFRDEPGMQMPEVGPPPPSYGTPLPPRSPLPTDQIGPPLREVRSPLPAPPSLRFPPPRPPIAPPPMDQVGPLLPPTQMEGFPVAPTQMEGFPVAPTQMEGFPVAPTQMEGFPGGMFDTPDTPFNAYAAPAFMQSQQGAARTVRPFQGGPGKGRRTPGLTPRQTMLNPSYRQTPGRALRGGFTAPSIDSGFTPPSIDEEDFENFQRMNGFMGFNSPPVGIASVYRPR
jgi:hypothetical protein